MQAPSLNDDYARYPAPMEAAIARLREGSHKAAEGLWPQVDTALNDHPCGQPLRLTMQGLLSADIKARQLYIKADELYGQRQWSDDPRQEVLYARDNLFFLLRVVTKLPFALTYQTPAKEIYERFLKTPCTPEQRKAARWLRFFGHFAPPLINEWPVIR